jgi:hypothetical protein
MTGRWMLETPRGPIALRPEQPEDADFLYALFRSHTLPGLAALTVDDRDLSRAVSGRGLRDPGA